MSVEIQVISDSICASILLTHSLDTTNAYATAHDHRTRGLQVNVRKEDRAWDPPTERSERPKPVLATSADCLESLERRQEDHDKTAAPF